MVGPTCGSAHNGAMDSLGTWPLPLTADDRGFDAQVMKRLRTGPAPRRDGDADRPAPVERLDAALVLAIPLAAALAVVLLWQQWSRSGSALLLVLLAGILVGAALWWVSRLRRAFAGAQRRLGCRLADVVVHGVGVVRELSLAPVPGEGAAEGADAQHDGRVRARLELSVSPVSGPGFSTAVEAVYDAGAARRLQAGSHGPVRFLRDDPAGTTAIETRLSAAQVEQVYRAAALN